MDRTRVGGLLASLMLLLAACGGSQSAAPATSSAGAQPSASTGAGTDAQLYTAAKAEGQVVLYSSNDVDETQKIIAAFNSKYPGITVKHQRGVRDELSQKALTEFQAKRVSGDIFQAASSSVFDMEKAGALQAYERPDLSAYPADMKDPQNVWSTSAMLIYAPGYNTTKVKASEAPKTYEDMLDPKWKGRLAVHELETQVTQAMMDWWGKDKTMQYWQGIKAQNPTVRRGRSLMVDQLIPGEFDMAVSLHTYTVQGKKDQGAPIDWVRLPQMVADLTTEALMNGAPHPNAAKLYLNWLVSLDGQKAVSSVGRIAVHPQISSPLTDGVKLYLLKPAPAELSNEADKLYSTALGIKGA
jgi:iron(III) transport system substrate-binding protein